MKVAQLIKSIKRTFWMNQHHWSQNLKRFFSCAIDHQHQWRLPLPMLPKRLIQWILAQVKFQDDVKRLAPSADRSTNQNASFWNLAKSKLQLQTKLSENYKTSPFVNSLIKSFNPRGPCFCLERSACAAFICES